MINFIFDIVFAFAHNICLDLINHINSLISRNKISKLAGSPKLELVYIIIKTQLIENTLNLNFHFFY